MFSKTPSVRIDKVERVEISTPFHPLWEEVLLEYLKARRQGIPYAIWPFVQAFQLPSESEDEETGLLKTLDYASKAVSVLSGVAVIVFVALLWSGQATIGNIQIGTLLTILSFTLVGGLISIGGVKMFSINASLRKAKERIERVVTTAGGCPFASIVDDEARRRYDVISPFKIGRREFCNGCHLIDHNGRTVCRVSPYYVG